MQNGVKIGAFYKESHETDKSKIELIGILAKVKDPVTIGAATMTIIFKKRCLTPQRQRPKGS